MGALGTRRPWGRPQPRASSGETETNPEATGVVAVTGTPTVAASRLRVPGRQQQPRPRGTRAGGGSTRSLLRAAPPRAAPPPPSPRGVRGAEGDTQVPWDLLWSLFGAFEFFSFPEKSQCRGGVQMGPVTCTLVPAQARGR